MSSSIERLCWTYTFPFWIYVDQENPPPKKLKSVYKGTTCHFYRPYRTAPANFVGMPIPYKGSIPSAKYVSARFKEKPEFYSTAVIPELLPDDKGEYSLQIQMGSEWEKKINPFPMDSIRIDIEHTNNTPDGFVDDLIHTLISWTRIITSQWWIDRSVSGLMTYARNSVEINDKGEIIGFPNLSGKGRTPSGIEEPLNAKNWNEIIKLTHKEEDWLQHDIFYLDAHFLNAKGDLKAAVMNFALTIETYSEFTFKRLWDNRASTPFSKNRVMKGDNFIAYITNDLDRFINQSYKEINDILFEELEDLLFLRNRIAHGQSPEFLKNSTWHNVNKDKVKAIRKAVDHCMIWLDSLE